MSASQLARSYDTKGAKEGVWVPHLYKWLPHIGGIAGGSDFSNLAVFSHTDLNRGGDFPSRFKRITELADTLIIDEAHHFRNPGRKGDTETGEGGSRYYKLFDLLDNSVRSKILFMLTATPINNQISDFRHMTELFTFRACAKITCILASGFQTVFGRPPIANPPKAYCYSWGSSISDRANPTVIMALYLPGYFGENIRRK